MTPLDNRVTRARRLHQAGDIDRAEAEYRAVLADYPDHAEAWHLLALAAFQRGRSDEARDLVTQAIRLDPNAAVFHNTAGLADRALGRPADAEAAFRRAVTLDPHFAEPLANLASLLKDLGRPVEAVGLLTRALDLRQDNPVIAYNLGNARQSADQLADALAAYDRALALRPDYPEALNNRGWVLLGLGRTDAAATDLAAALALRPDYPDARVNLGHALQRKGYLAAALAELDRAAAAHPTHPAVRQQLGCLLYDLGRLHQALPHLEEAVRLAPDRAAAHVALGLAHFKFGDLGRAEAAFRRAIELRPGYPEAHNNLGTVHMEQGLLEAAAERFETAVGLRPEWFGARSNALLVSNYRPDIAPSEGTALHREKMAVLPAATAIPIRPAGRPLRVGYVSPDFRLHPVAHFLEPVLAHHDRQTVAVYAYADVAAPDPVTARLRSYCKVWRPTAGLSDAELVELIRSDDIDVLIDLAGHTSGNRLPVFAQRPARIQATWLGYPNTTGLPAVDYRLTDDVLDPPGENHGYAEELVRLPGGFCCYAPPPAVPAVASRSGRFTFASFHNLAKLNDRVLAVWAEVLRAVPDSDLLIFRNTLRGAARDRVLRVLTARGVAPSRIRAEHHAAGEWGYLALYAEADVVLDAWPWCGHTSTCESLWMGVPVLTLRGDRAAGRMGASLLGTLGLSEWVAEGEAGFVAAAARAAAEPGRLEALRAELRGRLMASRLCDGAAFTRGFEAALLGLTPAGPSGLR